jgi:bacterioferritin-associated ferredoxin
MYVCICNGLTEARVRDVARSTKVPTAKALYKHLGCAVDCGQCLRTARDIMHDECTECDGGALALAAE